MTLNEYQEGAGQTAIYPNRGNNFIYPTLGLLGEAGEVAEKVKKLLRDNDGMITEQFLFDIEKELGDVLWYVAMLSDELGMCLGGVAEANLKKLRSRSDRNQLRGSGDSR